MADLFCFDPPPPEYWDRRNYASLEEQNKDLSMSSTVYVGNLSFYTSEAQIYELFSRCGGVHRIIMGINAMTKTPCGFCFVEFFARQDALTAVNSLSNTKLDNRVVRITLDPGYRQGRQYGRGKTGAQVRDEKRTEYDVGRGGFGLAGATQAMAPDFRGGGVGTKRRYSSVDNGAPSSHSKPLDEPPVEREAKRNPRFREEKDGDSDAEA